MSLSYNNVHLTTLDESYVVFLTGDGISIQLISLSWSEEILKENSLLFTYLETNKQVIVYFNRPGECSPEKDCCR